MDFEKRIITDGETIIDKELLEYMEDGIVEAINTADNKVDKSEIYKYTAFGTCDTASATQEKVIVIDDPNWKLEAGNMITVRFSVTNVASNVTLNVNNTGAYGIRTSGESAYTGNSSTYCGNADRALTYIFDGYHWQWISSGAYPSSATNVSLGQGYTTCSTDASTKAKTASLSSYVLSTGGIVAVKFTYDVPASATLNINSKGAKDIYHKGAVIKDGVIKAGDTATFIYSTRYHLISIDRDETFSGDYNDLTNKPTIPSLNGYATEEYVKNEIAKIDIPSTETTTSTLPNYWKNRLDEISPKIEALQKEYGIDAFQFLWASDIHSVPGSSPNNTSYIGSIGRYMMDKHNIPFFTVSGDIMSQASHSNVETVWNEYDKLNTMFSPIRNDEFLATKGNHDGAWGSPVDGVYYLNNIGTKELFNAFYRRQTLDRNRVFGKDGTYFYVDCPNVRFYMLNTHTDGDSSKNSDGSAVYNPMKHFVLGNEQLNWIADTLLTVQEGQKVIFMGHAPIKACIDGSIFTGILTSYKNRNSYEGTTNITGQYWGTDEKYSKVSVNKDFANAKGDLVGYFHGHIHKDTITVDGNYPVISISTAGGDLRDDYLTNGTLTRVKGTPTETVMDLVTVTSDYIYCTRIGSGYDRKYNRATKEVTIDYDSAFVPEIEEEEVLTQGEITNEVTFTPDTRLSSIDGTYKTHSGIYASNDIPVKNGDVIRIYGATTWHGYGVVNAYSNTAYLIYADITTATGTAKSETTKYHTVSVDENNYMTITITSSEVDYIRFTGNGLGNGNVKIFRNAEMTGDNSIVYPAGSELRIGQRYSQSGGGYIADSQGIKSFSLTIPVESATKYTLTFENFDVNINQGGSTMYMLNSNKSVATSVNGSSNFYLMTEGVTPLDDGLKVEFTTYSDTKYIVVSVFLDRVVTTESDLSNYIITLEAPDTGLTQGDITSEVGYELNKRYSTSDGSIKTGNAKSLALDKIQVESGDVIRVKGLTYPAVAGEPVIAIYREDGSYLVGTNICTSNIGQVSNAKVFFDFEADSLTVTVAENSACRYIGISGYYTEPVIYRVTRNSEVDTTNLVVPNSTNTTDTDIWVNGYRFSSSGLVAEAGTSISNKIPIQKGDTIKISGVTLRENTDRLCVNITQANGSENDALGYFNNGISVGGVKLIEYKGYENGVYTFYIPNTYGGAVNYLRFAMPTPSDFSKVKVILNK